MIDNFDACLAFTLEQEGGYCDTPGDDGGATNHGITQATLAAWLGRPASVQEVQALDAATAGLIYARNYWRPINGDNLPGGIDLLVFDFAVNAGVGTSAKRLQAMLGLAADGQIGPVTLAALARHPAEWVIATLTYSHISYYKQLAGWAEFGAGWEARARQCQGTAMAMLPGRGV